MGSLLDCFVTEEPYVAIGGLFVVFPRLGRAGRFGGGGGGGLLPVLFDCAFKLLPTPCELRAAIRAWRELN